MKSTVKDVMTTYVVAVRRNAAPPGSGQGGRRHGGRPDDAPGSDDHTLGRDIVATVRHVEGVVAVRDRLSYPPSERPAGPGPLS